jgi:hypothetical protein
MTPHLRVLPSPPPPTGGCDGSPRRVLPSAAGSHPSTHRLAIYCYGCERIVVHDPEDPWDQSHCFCGGEGCECSCHAFGEGEYT